MTAPAPAELAHLHDLADRFFQQHLPGSWAPAYLSARGLTPPIQCRWHVGYAPVARDALTCHLREKGWPDTLIEASGLARRTRRGVFTDAFRDRVMLPIRSGDGAVVAFIGRASPHAPERAPKYLNSPSNCLYNKSAVLFGLWEAHEPLADGATPVIVEGPFDAIAVTLAGDGRHVGVAPCGTALTTEHAAALRRSADLNATGITVAFDSDGAGHRAAVRAYHVLSSSGITLTWLMSPTGSDPASVLARQGPAALATVLANQARPLADLVIDAELARWERWLAYPEGRANALHAAAPAVAAMPAHDIARQVVRLADRLGLRCSTVTDAVTKAVPAVVAAATRNSP
jgi:DNA primase